MRLTKFFTGTKSIDKNINDWVRESPQQRCILQITPYKITPYKEGVIVLYEIIPPKKDERESIKENFIKKPRKTTTQRR